jgi:3D (Asp-Asp-Asp) domain-containing protein
MTALLAALTAALTTPPPAGLTQHEKPTWVLFATAYQPHQRDNKPHLDRWGGGPNAAWTGQHLERWHCAVGKAVPLGTKLWVGYPVNGMMLAVDTGPGVRGKHLDICCPDPALFRRIDKWCQTQEPRATVRVWKLGKLTRAQARAWTPTRVEVAI